MNKESFIYRTCKKNLEIAPNLDIIGTQRLEQNYSKGYQICHKHTWSSPMNILYKF